MGLEMKCDEMVEELSKGGEVREVMAKVGKRNRGRMVKSKAWGRAVEMRMELGKMQARLVAARYAPHALGVLVNLLKVKRPELQLKAALAVLEEARVEGVGGGGGGEERGEGGAVRKEEMEALIKGLQGMESGGD